jgi:hypothetical protein
MYAEAHLVTVATIICLIIYSYVSILFSSLLISSCHLGGSESYEETNKVSFPLMLVNVSIILGSFTSKYFPSSSFMHMSTTVDCRQ